MLKTFFGRTLLPEKQRAAGQAFCRTPLCIGGTPASPLRALANMASLAFFAQSQLLFIAWRPCWNRDWCMLLSMRC